jgi:formyl-CoA transferase
MQDVIAHLCRVWTRSYLETGVSPPRTGNRLPGSPYQGTYACKPGGEDDYVYVTMGLRPEAIYTLFRVIGREDMAADKRWTDRVFRAQHAKEFDAALEAWTKRHTKHEAMRLLGEAGIPAGACLNADDLYHDPHLIEREMVVEVAHPQQGKVKLLGCPVKLSGSPVSVLPAPLLGQHTEQVLSELLQYAKADVDSLRNEGLV